MNVDDRTKPQHFSIPIAALAEAPPNDSVRQTVLDAAERHPDYDFVEVHELLQTMGRPVDLRYVIGAMQSL
jgi:hypothetical protein